MGGLQGPWPRPRRWPLLLARQKMLPGEVVRTAWEERADGPANAIEWLIGADPEGGKALGGLDEPWPRCPAPGGGGRGRFARFKWEGDVVSSS